MPSYMAPTTIGYDTLSTIEAEADEEFMTFIKEELRARNYMRLYIYKVTRTDDSREE